LVIKPASAIIKPDMSGQLHLVSQRKNTGFTIVELLIVVVVIAILAAITIVAYNGIQQRARTSAMVSTLSQASKKLELYKVDNNSTYPATLSEGQVVIPGDYNANYERTTGLNGYCLVVTQSNVSYKVSSDAQTPAAGGCNISSGLVGSWNFNGNANDSSPSGMNGTVVGATLTTGQNGQSNGAYSFNGTSNYIGLSNTTPINFTNGQFTVSAWVNMPTTLASSVWYDILSSTTVGDWSVGIVQDTVGEPRLAMTKVGEVDAPRGPVVTPGSWRHVTVIYKYGPSPSTVSYYVDGVLASTVNWNHVAQGDFSIGAGNKRIGARSNRTFLGSIDDLRVYNKALSSAEISSLYAAGAQ
jgi:prepilin-type N-terminal cleavage/methylation domain-containing protein